MIFLLQTSFFSLINFQHSHIHLLRAPKGNRHLAILKDISVLCVAMENKRLKEVSWTDHNLVSVSYFN